MSVKKIEIQDSVGDVYHPHTTTDVVFEGGVKLSDLLKKLIKADGSVPMTGSMITKDFKICDVLTGEQIARIYAQGDYMYLGHLHSSKALLAMDIRENSAAILPNTPRSMDLGNGNYPWSNLYVGNVSRNTNGYTTLPNGMIMQWGFVGEVSGTSWSQVTFPVAFQNTPLNLSATLYWGLDANFGTVITGEYSSVGFQVAAKIEDARKAHIYWVAIGY